MIRVGYDISPLSSGHKFRGVGTYTKNLLERLKKHREIEILEFENNSNIPNVDLVHYTYFDLFAKTLPFNRKFPTVVTIHDVIPLVFPNHYPSGIKGQINLQFQKLSLKSALAVITDSNSSKVEITKHLAVPQSKIYVTHLASSPDFKVINDQSILKTVSKTYSLPDKFAIYIGNVNWNKNLLGICQASLDANLDLVLVGKSFEETQNLSHPELKSFAQFLDQYSKHPLIHILGFVPNEDLVPLLNLASIMLFPSFAEGFGIPILEAQACGVPVITSKTSSMPEVGGEGAYYVNPYNTDEIVAGIKKLVSDTHLKQDLIKKGHENIKRFSWDKTAEETFKVYEKVLAK